MRVLMVVHPLYASNVASRMAPAARQVASLRAAGVDVTMLEVDGLPKLKYLQSLPTLQKVAQSADIVHAHFGYCAWLARSQFRKPVVVSFMGSDLLGEPGSNGNIPPLSKVVVRFNRWLASHVDAVIVKSAEMARIVLPIKAHVVPNGVDMQLFRPIDTQEARKMLGWPEGKRYVLFPGNPMHTRKYFPLAQSTVQIAAQSTSVPIELISLWKVGSDQVPIYMNACDAMLMTSFIEGSPNVVKEAMACNLPVVSVPVGDVPEMLEGVEGCTVCPYEPEALADAIVMALDDNQETNGRAILKERHLDLDGVAQRIVSIYSDVLASPRAS